MNERIKELAIEAGAVIYEFSESIGYGTLDFDVQRFAVLIIQECADFVAEGEFGDPGAARELKKYFGMEEGK